MFPGADIEAITNGVHAGTWTSPPFQQLFDRYIPSWREDNYSCAAPSGCRRGSLGRSSDRQARLAGDSSPKNRSEFDPEVFTIGFARRATGYKRADLILADLDRLRQMPRTPANPDYLCRKAHPKRWRRKRHYSPDFPAKKHCGNGTGGFSTIQSRARRKITSSSIVRMRLAGINNLELAGVLGNLPEAIEIGRIRSARL